jgi:hypothetical protein
MRFYSKFMIWLFLSLTTGLFVSCSLEHENGSPATIASDTPDATAEWTVLFYGAGNYAADVVNGISNTISTVQSFQEVFLTEQVHVVALVASPATDGACRMYDLRYRPRDANDDVSSILLSDWGQQNMASAQVLKQFVDSSVARYPARKYMLVMSGYSDGWKGVCLDEINGNNALLKLPDMQATLEQVSTVEHLPVNFDLLLWLSPRMSTLEVAYQFRDKADFMVATPWFSGQNPSIAAERWLLDLVLNPAISGEQLGEYIVARTEHAALHQGDSLSACTMLRLDKVDELADATDALAQSLAAQVEQYSNQLLMIWESAWVSATDDSQAIDLLEFTDLIMADPTLSGIPALQQSCQSVQTAIANAVVNSRTTHEGDTRSGVMVYFPTSEETADISEYQELSLAQEHGDWLDFLNTLFESGSSFVTLSGTVVWRGTPLINDYLFIDTTQAGTLSPLLTIPITYTEFFNADSARFQVSFALPFDSLLGHIGVFQDVQGDGQLSSGDRVGVYGTGLPRRLWHWIDLRPGLTRDSVNVQLSITF